MPHIAVSSENWEERFRELMVNRAAEENDPQIRKGILLSIEITVSLVKHHNELESCGAEMSDAFLNTLTAVSISMTNAISCIAKGKHELLPPLLRTSGDFMTAELHNRADEAYKAAEELGLLNKENHAPH